MSKETSDSGKKMGAVMLGCAGFNKVGTINLKVGTIRVKGGKPSEVWLQFDVYIKV
jgi:hypothetical protein